MFSSFFHNSTKNFNIAVNCMPFSVVLWLVQSLDLNFSYMILLLTRKLECSLEFHKDRQAAWN